MSGEYSPRPGMGTHDGLAVGGVVGDTYRVTRLLGRGGMGAVWAAEHVRLPGRQVAVKVLLSPGVAADESFARFRREAEIASRLGHPHIVQVLDFNTLPSGEPYIVLELLEGETLAQRLQRGPLELEEALGIARQVGSALQAAHRAGVVHRDLKPDNVFLCAPREENPAPQAKVLDFGISKIRGSQTVATQDAVLMGTPQYMAPEQALGRNAAIDARTDVFALGAIVYEMLGGRPAFAGSSLAEVVYKVVHAQPQPLAQLRTGLPLNILSSVDRALQKEPAHRPGDVNDFIAELTGRPLTVPATLRPASVLDATVASPARALPVPGGGTDQTFTPATPVPLPLRGGERGATEPLAGRPPAHPWNTPTPAGRAPSSWAPAASTPAPVAPLVGTPRPVVPAPALAAPRRRRFPRWILFAVAGLAAIGVFRRSVRATIERAESHRPAPPAAVPQPPEVPTGPAIPPVPAVPGLPPEAQEELRKGLEDARRSIREALGAKAAEQADEVKRRAEAKQEAAAARDKAREERRSAAEPLAARAGAPADVETLLSDAEEALDDEDPKLAIRLADQSFFARKTSAGWAVKARAFCQLKDLGNARAALANVTGKADRTRVLADCKEHDFPLR